MPFITSSDFTVDDIAVADLDRNGRDDVVVLTSTSSSSTPYLHVVSVDTSGNFTASSVTYTSNRSTIAYYAGASIALGELTGDSFPDALITYALNLNYGVRVLLSNSGSGTLVLPGTTTILGNQPPVATLGDANGDSILDLFLTTSGGSVNVYLASAVGVFGSNTTTPGGVASGHLHFADLTGDGRLEAMSSNNGLSIGLNDGSGAYPFWSKYLPGAVVNRPLTAQMDADGLLDIIFGTGTDGVRVFHGNGFGGVIGDSKAYAVAQGNVAVAFPIDVTNDGCTDLVAFHDGALFSVLPAIGQETYDTYRTYPGLAGQVQTADLNDDGLVDFASATTQGVGVVLSNP